MKLSITLENGNVLEEKDLNDIPFNDMLSHKFFQNWEPGETLYLNKVVSISIPVEYAEYPVKDVVLDYSLDLENQVDKMDEEIALASMSVLDKWRLSVIRVKSGKADTNDSDFPDKLLIKTAGRDKDKNE